MPSPNLPNDPKFDDPAYRTRPVVDGTNWTPWMLGIVAALAVVGLLTFMMRDGDRVATPNRPAIETTGTTAPARPTTRPAPETPAVPAPAPAPTRP